jgi:hypothetical protein
MDPKIGSEPISHISGFIDHLYNHCQKLIVSISLSGACMVIGAAALYRHDVPEQVVS